MLEISRSLRLNRQTNYLKNFFLDTFIIAEEKAQKYQVNILLQLHDHLTFCSFDYYHLQHALLNIIASAVDASAKNGEVIIRSRCSKDCWEVEVAASGKGIPDYLVDVISQPFFSNKKRGADLGLPIAKLIIEAHDGELQCERQGSQGMVFRIVLPDAIALPDAVV